MTKKIVLVIILSLLALGGAIGYYFWNKPNTNAADIKPNYILPADSLGAAFAKDEESANAKFVKDSVAIEIQGVVDTSYVNEGNEAEDDDMGAPMRMGREN